ncbi:MAG: hypothetical protein PHS49_02045 [Candidatus Gracilibacteria bacterium]|nr:hypothetical protein [Candidatus Gracilibacteria bacterium]
MKKIFNPIITLSSSGAENLAKVMSGELKSNLSKEKLKGILTSGLSMKKNLRTK